MNKLLQSIDSLELSVRTSNCLHSAGIEKLYQLVTKSKSHILKLRSLGRRSLRELEEQLDCHGLSFGMWIDDSDVIVCVYMSLAKIEKEIAEVKRMLEGNII